MPPIHGGESSSDLAPGPAEQLSCTKQVGDVARLAHGIAEESVSAPVGQDVSERALQVALVANGLKPCRSKRSVQTEVPAEGAFQRVDSPSELGSVAADQQVRVRRWAGDGQEARLSEEPVDASNPGSPGRRCVGQDRPTLKSDVDVPGQHVASSRWPRCETCAKGSRAGFQVLGAECVRDTGTPCRGFDRQSAPLSTGRRAGLGLAG